MRARAAALPYWLIAIGFERFSRETVGSTRQPLTGGGVILIAPASADSTSRSRVIPVLCNLGLASSLSAASLHRIGLTGATDVEGGFRAWKEAGLPVLNGSRPGTHTATG